MLPGDYVSGLQVLTELVEMIENHTGSRVIGNYQNVLHRCEISRVLLLLILRPTPQRLAPSLAQVLEKYAWAEDTPISGRLNLIIFHLITRILEWTPLNPFVKFTVPNMTEDEMLLLQSLVLACQSRDYGALLELESELWRFFDTEQKELLRKLIETFNRE